MVLRKISTNYPAADLVRKDPKVAAMISKAERDRNATTARDAEGNRKTPIPHSYAFKTALQKRAKRNSDAVTILKLLPDIELSIQILVSSILSPADMMASEVTYTGPKNLLGSELQAGLLNRLKEHFEEVYKIRPLLPKILRDVLAEKGAYPVAVIPENAIDAFINSDKNVTMESLSEFVTLTGKPKPIGILGNYKKGDKSKKIGLSFENFNNVTTSNIVSNLHYVDVKNDDTLSYTEEKYLFVTDNPSTLKFSKVNEKIRNNAIKEAFNKGNKSISLEDKVSDTKIESMIFRNRAHTADPVGILKKQGELSRRSVGNPLIMKLPSESVIPVHVPGNVEQHIGYFVILDEEGNPIESNNDDYYYGSMGGNMNKNSGNSLSSNIIKRVETNIGGSNSFDPSNSTHLDFAAQVYSDMIERDLISRVKNGIHSNEVSLANNEEVYRIMLSRVLAKKYTQILFLPVEYVTYFAFKYSEDGIGRSLLDDTSMINTLRTVLLFTDVIASIKNSIGRTAVTMTLPANDPNPLKTIEKAQDEIVRSRQLGIPLGVTNPSDITEFIQRAGFEWKFDGHPGLPDLKFDIQNTNTSYTKPDTDLQDFLRKSSIMAMGLSPEMVDTGFNTEFATSVVANNVLLGKRVMQYQEIFCPLLSDHLRKVASHSSELLEDLRAMLKENIKSIKINIEEIEQDYGTKIEDAVKEKLIVNKALNIFLNTFEVTLPKPPSVTLANQLDDLKVYTDGLDTALDAYISDTFMTTTTSGELSNEINTIKAMIKSYFTRKYLADNGLMTELSELTALTEEGDPQMNFMKEMTMHVEALVRSGVTSIIKLAPIAQAATTDLSAITTGGGEDSSTDEAPADDGIGGDDFDIGGDLDEAPADTPVNPDEEPVVEKKSDETEEKKPAEETPDKLED